MPKFKDFITEAKKVTVEVEFQAESRSELSKYEIDFFKEKNIKIKFTKDSVAFLTGTKEDIISYLTDEEFYGADLDEVKKLYPELFK